MTKKKYNSNQEIQCNDKNNVPNYSKHYRGTCRVIRKQQWPLWKLQERVACRPVGSVEGPVDGPCGPWAWSLTKANGLHTWKKVPLWPRSQNRPQNSSSLSLRIKSLSPFCKGGKWSVDIPAVCSCCGVGQMRVKPKWSSSRTVVTTMVHCPTSHTSSYWAS